MTQTINPKPEQCVRCQNKMVFLFKIKDEYEARCIVCGNRMFIFKEVVA